MVANFFTHSLSSGSKVWQVRASLARTTVPTEKHKRTHRGCQSATQLAFPFCSTGHEQHENWQRWKNQRTEKNWSWRKPTDEEEMTDRHPVASGKDQSQHEDNGMKTSTFVEKSSNIVILHHACVSRVSECLAICGMQNLSESSCAESTSCRL